MLDLLVGVNQNETSLCINLTFETPANNFQAITYEAFITSAFAPELRDGVRADGRWLPDFVSTSRLARLTAEINARASEIRANSDNLERDQPTL